jgi:hypothetical protein
LCRYATDAEKAAAAAAVLLKNKIYLADDVMADWLGHMVGRLYKSSGPVA